MASLKVAPMRIQLWSYNYSPEPTGIGPVSHTWAKELAARGHEVTVVAAHPHYPEPSWGRRLRPTRNSEDGVNVIRLPLWVGRDSALARMRQDATFSAALLASLPLLPRADLRVVVSPCFPALTCAIAMDKLGGAPWLLWIQDILPDGAINTGLVDQEGAAIRLSRRLERSAYRAADRIVVISDRFEQNLLAKGVPPSKLERIYNPATLPLADGPRVSFSERPDVLVMGNIGHSQGLAGVVRDFESDAALAELGARLTITGTGVAADEVKAAITTERVVMKGVVTRDQLLAELDTATVGLVAQAPGIPEFNFPSKLMNYLARGLPVAGFVAAGSEVSQVLASSGAGVTIDNGEPGALGGGLAQLLRDHEGLLARSAAAFGFAEQNLTTNALGNAFEAAFRPLR
jgi:colanic acid biosynthesis glycosyl transferase WcaI